MEDNLKQNILAVISGLLCEERDLRNVAEDRRKALEFKPEYPVKVAEILFDFEEPLEERLMCALMLKKYINQFWESNFCTNEEKATTRTLLSHALGDQNVKIVDSAAYLLGMIAQVDYPHTWKEMLSMLTDKLRSQDQRIVIGGVTFMQECFQKIPHLLQENLINDAMYDFFYGITEQEHIYNTTLRSKVVELVTCYIIEDFKRDYAIARVGPTANRFTAIMCYILNQPYSVNSDFQIKAIIVSSFTKFLCGVPEMVGQLVISTLPIMWDILIACTGEFRQIIGVRSNSNAFLQNRVLPLDAGESGYPANFMTLVDNIFAMVEYVCVTEEPFACIDTDAYMNDQHLTDIIYSILTFGCATPYTERDIYHSDFEYADDQFTDEIQPSYVSVSNTNFSRDGLRHLLRVVIKSRNEVRSLACMRIAIVRALEYIQLRRSIPLPPEILRLKYLEDECDVMARASQNAVVAGHVVGQRTRVPQPIFTPVPGGYDVYTSRVSEGVMFVLCNVSSLMGTPENILTLMVLPNNEQVHLDNNIDRRARPQRVISRPSIIEFTIRSYLNKLLDIVQADDVLMNCRLMLAAAHYGWIFSKEEYNNHLRNMLEHLHGDFEICGHAAVRALKVHCSYFKGDMQRNSNYVNLGIQSDLQNVFVQYVHEFNSCLVSLAQFAHVEMLKVIISNITDLVVMNVHASEDIVEFIMTSLSTHMDSNSLVKNIKVLIEMLTCFVRNKSYFQRQLLQPILDVIRHGTRNATVDDTERFLGKAVGLDLFGEMLRTVDDLEVKRAMINAGFRIVYMALLTGPSDVEVAHNGQRCLSMYMLRFGEQILHMRPVVTCELFITVFNHMMDLSQPEEMCVGLEHPFLSMLIIFYEEFVFYLDAFVKSLLSRLNHAQSMDVRNSLIMMFLGTFYYHIEPTMRLLDMLPGPDGTTSALHFIVPLLLDVHYNSAYTQNLYVRVVTSLMQQAFVMDDHRILDLIVEHNYPREQLPHHAIRAIATRRTNNPLAPSVANGLRTAATLSSALNSGNTTSVTYGQQSAEPRPHNHNLESKLNCNGATQESVEESDSGSRNGQQFSSDADNGVSPDPNTSSASFLMENACAEGAVQAGENVTSAAVEVESMDLSCSSTSALNLGPSDAPPLNIQTRANVLSLAAALQSKPVNNNVPFLRKALRMLLSVLLANRRNDDMGEIIVPEPMLFPDADPRMDIRLYQELDALSTMDVVSFLENFFNNLVEYNYFDRFELCVDLNTPHRREVERVLQRRGVKLPE